MFKCSRTAPDIRLSSRPWPWRGPAASAKPGPAPTARALGRPLLQKPGGEQGLRGGVCSGPARQPASPPARQGGVHLRPAVDCLLSRALCLGTSDSHVERETACSTPQPELSQVTSFLAVAWLWEGCFLAGGVTSLSPGGTNSGLSHALEPRRADMALGQSTPWGC